ncbi:MAG: hypothetical protein ACTSRP_10915 [Candidatus Helarchaeota archaeon]
MIFKLEKVYLGLDIEKIKHLLLNPSFWEDVVENTKKISITKTSPTKLHQEMVMEVEIDSLGLIKRDVETIQDVVFNPEEPYFDEVGSFKTQIIKVKVENSNQLRYFDGIIKIDEKPGKARIIFTLDKIGLKDSLVELLGIQLTIRRMRRELKRIMEKVAVYQKEGILEKFYKNS